MDISILITGLCQFDCSYCINKITEFSMNSYLYDVDKIQADIDLLNTIDDASVDISGGEPTLHPKFAEIVNAMTAQTKHQINVLTNLTNLDKLMMLNVEDNLLICPALHFEYYNPKMLDKLQTLNEKYDVCAVVILHEDYLELCEQVIEELKSRGIGFRIQPIIVNAEYGYCPLSDEMVRIIEANSIDNFNKVYNLNPHGKKCKSSVFVLYDNVLRNDCFGYTYDGEIKTDVCKRDRCVCGLKSMMDGKLDLT